uniref:DAO domain-containing protein n=1 Tax=Angiostrongylus cantonensis TaxID=6313 RepID=A0A0K0DM12_ANGCA
LYSALAAHLPEVKLRGAKYFHVYCVDNILCKVADPHLLGFFIEKRADVATKYSELGAELAERKTDDGRLLFCAGSIANHFFSLDFLESFCSDNFHLPYHRASKKIAHLSSDGKIVKPVTPNGIKLEQFVFDVFERSRNFYIWEVEREDEFSPLKNAESAGKECLSTCKKDLASLNRKWLEAAGAKVIGDPIYLQTSVSYCGEGLDRFKGQSVSGPLLK